MDLEEKGGRQDGGVRDQWIWKRKGGDVTGQEEKF